VNRTGVDEINTQTISITKARGRDSIDLGTLVGELARG